MPEPVVSAADWRAADLEASGRWLHRPDPAAIADLKAGFARLKAGGKPSIRDMVEGVYATMPPHLRRQRQKAGV